MRKLSLIFLTMLCSAAFADTVSRLDLDNIPRLRTGAILDEYILRDEAGGAIRVEILMRANVEDIWAVLLSCDQAFKFVAGLRTCEVIEQRPGFALIHQVADRGLFVPLVDFVYESRRQPFSRIDFKQIEGNLKAMQGSWDFITVEEGVVVIYNMQVQPGMAAPRFIVRKSLRNSIPDMLACIRGLVEGSGSVDLNEKDLARCSDNS